MARRWASTFRPQWIPRLPDTRVDSFKPVFESSLPTLFPRKAFQSLPAVSNWFIPSPTSSLKYDYLDTFGDVTVPIELNFGSRFDRTDTKLSAFLAMSNQKDHASGVSPQAYLAQCPITDLPSQMRGDLPTPELVKLVGKGDVYQSSIWIGNAPTFTPLHRDPNPNLFVQLCGKKLVRILEPGQGERVFHDVKRRLAEVAANPSFRGEEMMAGPERDLLENVIWDAPDPDAGIFEAQLEAGDGIFIPKGWWHSIKGVGQGMTASVNWWFR